MSYCTCMCVSRVSTAKVMQHMGSDKYSGIEPDVYGGGGEFKHHKDVGEIAQYNNLTYQVATQCVCELVVAM